MSLFKNFVLGTFNITSKRFSRRFRFNRPAVATAVKSNSTTKWQKTAMPQDPAEQDLLLETAEHFASLHDEVRSSGDYTLSRDEMIRAEKKAKEWLKNKIIEKKYFKKEQEPNLLTYDAKEQIRYLNAEYPEEWTPEKISESFPISVEGARKLLKSKCMLKTLDEVRKHDTRVIKHWEKLEPQKSKEICSRYLGAGFKPQAADLARLSGVNASLPAPLKRLFQILPEKSEDRQPGKLEAMVIKHIMLKEEREKQVELFKSAGFEIVGATESISNSKQNFNKNQLRLESGKDIKVTTEPKSRNYSNRKNVNKKK